jgi:DNA-binding response OmpR family regulator
MVVEQPKVLLAVGSDPDWRVRIRASVAEAPIEVREASSGQEAFALGEKEVPDLIVVDMVLEDMTGLGLCRMLREQPRLRPVPIIMVSSYSSEIDRILAFECGVDDYLAKPFFGRELLSRVRAVLRRSTSEPEVGDELAPIRCGPVRYDPERRLIEVNGQRTDLTRTEFDLLALLIRHEGKVMRRQQMLKQVGGEGAVESDRVVDAHIKAIRRKLGDARDCIQTVRGVGYRFVSAELEAHPA